MLMEKSKYGMFLSPQQNQTIGLTISEMIITLRTPSFNLNKQSAQEPLAFGHA
jgi:hypothetical protein